MVNKDKVEPSKTKRCTCGQVLPGNAVLCVACGFHFEKGARIETEHGALMGLYRDKHMLVVDRSVANFPNRCLWDNRPTDGELTRVTIWYLPPSLAGAVGSIASKQTARLSIPICQHCKRKASRLSRFGYILAAVASLIGVAALAIVVIAQSNRSPPPWIASGAFIVALVVAFFGIVLGKAKADVEDQVHVVFLDEALVWMQGVSREFLQGLPAWTGDSRRQRQVAAHR